MKQWNIKHPQYNRDQTEHFKTTLKENGGAEGPNNITNTKHLVHQQSHLK
jgi:hypothetical protein